MKSKTCFKANVVWGSIGYAIKNLLGHIKSSPNKKSSMKAFSISGIYFIEKKKVDPITLKMASILQVSERVKNAWNFVILLFVFFYFKNPRGRAHAFLTSDNNMLGLRSIWIYERSLRTNLKVLTQF